MKTRYLIAFMLLAVSMTAGAQTAKPEQAEKVTFPSVACTGQPIACNRLEGLGYLFSKTGQKSAVLISHGSQGIDARMYDYVDALQKEGFAALVLDHWTPRGVQNTHNDYAAAALKGANELNMAFDSLLAAEWLRGKGFEKIGSIGESQGGASAIFLTQAYMHETVVRNYRRIYATQSFTLKPLDAVVGMYGYCGLRHAHRDKFLSTPFLFITGEKDDETPSKFCEQYVPWMNDRGGNAKVVVIPGEYHSFDAPFGRTRQYGRNFKDCDLLHDEKTITWVKTGKQVPHTSANQRALLDECAGKGYTTGHSGNRFVAVPHWIGFFKQNL